MSLTTPSKIRELQIKLYRKAKNEPGSASVRHFLRRRHKVPSRGTTRFSDNVIFGELGVVRLRQVQLGPRS